MPAAYSADGVIEAVTLQGHSGWYLGVQWHPEDSAATDPVQAAVFGHFVRAASARAAGARAAAVGAAAMGADDSTTGRGSDASG